MDTYSHVFPELERESMDKLDFLYINNEVDANEKDSSVKESLEKYIA